MANPTVPAAVPARPRVRSTARRGRRLWQHRSSYLLTLPYVLFLLVFGVAPGLYALALSFSNLEGGEPKFFAAGINNYITAFSDTRFPETMGNLLAFLVISVPLGIGFVILLALLLDMRPGWVSSALRTLFFIPGAVTGPALFLLAICILNPDISPFGPIYHAAGINSFDDLVGGGSLPFIFMAMGFFSGAGMWIAIQHGGLQGISKEVLEAAQLDGCNAWQRARYIKLPFIKPFIVYQIILIFAVNVQLFVEPQLMASTWVQANIAPQWAPNQLAYSFAFEVGNFGAAAALSLFMLLIGLIAAYVMIRLTGFFKIEA